MRMKNSYHSCYICDVKVDDTSKVAILTDSSQKQYHVDLNDNTLLSDFNCWFKTVFCKGIAQTLTVFQYVLKDISECETEVYISKFLNLQNNQKTFV